MAPVTEPWASVQLEAERAQTAGRLNALTAELESIVAASLGANGDDEHDPEGATVAFERERTAALRAQTEAYMGDLDRARARVAEGTYGTCRSCRQPIAEERLRVLPATELCVTCSRLRPIPTVWTPSA
jgi:RNA polymerase-binding transcription factor DksA